MAINHWLGVRACRSAVFGVCRLVRISLVCAVICSSGSGFAQGVYGPIQRQPVSTTQPDLRVTLSRPVYHITIDPKSGAPQMPCDVTANAEVVNWPAGIPKPTVFQWHVLLHWNYKPYPTAHRVETQSFTQKSPFVVPLEGQVRGGTLTVVVSTPPGERTLSGKAQAEVLADNPSHSLVLRAFPPNRTGLIASKICMAESGLHQFTEAKGLESGGQPYVSPSKDIGLMQLNAPSGGISSADEVWDWRANIRRGLAMLGEKRQIVLASRGGNSPGRSPAPYTFEGCANLAAVNMCRLLCGLDWLSLPPPPPISDAPGSGILAGEPDPDHLQLTQREREAIRRYNGGSEYACDLCVDSTCLNVRVVGWQPDPTRGGINPKRGDPNYVDHVLLARSGFTLPKPPKAPVHPTKRRVRKSRR